MILCVTLNPSMDRRIDIEDMLIGQVNRVYRVEAHAGGKGIHVATAVMQLGHESLVTGILGDSLGDWVENDLHHEGISTRFIRIEGETRINFSIHIAKTGLHLEILEPGPTVKPEEIAMFESLYRELLVDSGVVVFSGSLPQGLPFDTYSQLVCEANHRGIITIVDTSGSALQEVLAAHPTFVKPNRVEVEKLIGTSLSCEADLIHTLSSPPLLSARSVIISLAEDGAIARWNEQGILYAKPPQVEVANPIGSGDCMVAGMAVALEQGMNAEETIRFAVACGTAGAVHPRTGWIDTTKLIKFYDLVKVSWLQKF